MSHISKLHFISNDHYVGKVKMMDEKSNIFLHQIFIFRVTANLTGHNLIKISIQDEYFKGANIVLFSVQVHSFFSSLLSTIL